MLSSFVRSEIPQMLSKQPEWCVQRNRIHARNQTPSNSSANGQSICNHNITIYHICSCLSWKCIRTWLTGQWSSAFVL